MNAANNLPREQIENELKKLIGLRAWGATLTAGMLTVSFGDRHTHTTKSGRAVEIGDYALHALSSWRFARNNEIIVGFVDYLNASEDGRIGKIHDFLAQVLAESPAVKEVAHVRGGAFSLVLEGGLYLEVFPAASANEPGTEFWRLFRPASPIEDGFELTAAGILTEHD